MKRHTYLRAYMAGVLLPTWLLLVAMTLYVVGHLTRLTPERLETAIVFPMAVVPNAWGIWNVLYVKFGLRARLPLGVFGAMLPVVLVPAGVVLARILGLQFYSIEHAVFLLPVVMAIYYLGWKYAVAAFNRIVEVG